MTLEDLVIDGPWSETAGENPDNFLLYDSGPMADSRVVVFAADQCLEKLGSAETCRAYGWELLHGTTSLPTVVHVRRSSSSW